MYPPIFEACASDPDVQSNLGVSPTRLFAFGEADYPNVTYPYAVWRTVAGTPENKLSGRPDIDRWTIQIDVYAKTADGAWDAAAALRNIIEQNAYVNAWRGGVRDPDTRSFTYSFTVDWWVPRTEVDSNWPA